MTPGHAMHQSLYIPGDPKSSETKKGKAPLLNYRGAFPFNANSHATYQGDSMN
jgi:hypothetical protein